MEPAERDELHAALEAVGCHRLASRVCYFDDPMVAELRSLLRREVWVATCEECRELFAWRGEVGDMPPCRKCGCRNVYSDADLLPIETEVPDGQG